MNIELFIAKRIVKSTAYKSSLSAPIIKIAIGAVALGMFMMIVSVATGLGLQEKITEKVSGFSGHIVIGNYDNMTSKNQQKPISVVQEFYPDFTQVDGVKHVQAFATRPGIVRTETDFEGVIFKGVDAEYDWRFLQSYISSGVVPNFGHKLSSEVFISKKIADRLQFKVGDKFDTFFMKDDRNKLPNRRVFKVVGIYDTGFKELDENLILGDIKQVQRLNKWGKTEVGGFEVFIDDFSELKDKTLEVYSEIPSNLDASNIYEIYPQIFEWMNLFKGNIYVIIIIMIIVASINMITALLVLILERTQLIGILKTIGTSSLSIRKVFLYNAIYIISRGLVIGNVTALLLIFLQSQFHLITLNPENYYVNYAPVHITLLHIIYLNVGTLLLCVLMMIVPSYMITKINPATSVKVS